ncbi:MAG: CRISPR-associated endonuclease Cas1, partial [Candidatus Izemoplasmatales bacterium]|nr:CRISPR-associated endonuclease Cas1 [Candidatus Izemoplasmatales bacterium]
MFRTVLIRKSSKLQYLQGYLVIFDGEDEKKVFLDDISVLLIESTSTLITVPLMIQLIKNNIAVLLCDEKHNPVGTLLGINNHYNLSGNLYKQLNWKDNITADLWVEIVRMKIQNQLKVLKIFEKSNQE